MGRDKGSPQGVPSRLLLWVRCCAPGRAAPPDRPPPPSAVCVSVSVCPSVCGRVSGCVLLSPVPLGVTRSPRCAAPGGGTWSIRGSGSPVAGPGGVGSAAPVGLDPQSDPEATPGGQCALTPGPWRVWSTRGSSSIPGAGAICGSSGVTPSGCSVPPALAPAGLLSPTQTPQSSPRDPADLLQHPQHHHPADPQHSQHHHPRASTCAARHEPQEQHNLPNTTT